jgi:hypothetical protein
MSRESWRPVPVSRSGPRTPTLYGASRTVAEFLDLLQGEVRDQLALYQLTAEDHDHLHSGAEAL